MKWAFLDKTESIINQKLVLAEKISAWLADPQKPLQGERKKVVKTCCVSS